MPMLATKEYCTGCTACASICPKGSIAMEADENGFLYPVIDAERCVDCGLCERSCAVINPLEKPKNEPLAYAAYTKDETLRTESSSGGVFTELAKVVLAEKGAVFGATYNHQFEVVHICVENEDGLKHLRGAKYAQSNLQGVFSEAKYRLDHGQKVLFSGTPCQVGGLKAYLRKDYSNLITVDFVCHSVPSPMAWRQYVKYRAQKDNAGRLPAAINLRSKKTGWSRYQYSNLFEYENGIEQSAKSDESIYMKLFVNGYINRTSCDNCHFKGFKRASDITLGDFWGIWDAMPEMDDNRGTSVVLIHSSNGAELFDRAMIAGIVRPVTLEQASSQNRAILISSRSNCYREEALNAIRNGDFEKCEEMIRLKKDNFMTKIKGKFKSLFLC